MFKRINALSPPKLFLLNCIIYAGIWGTAFIFFQFENELQETLKNAALSITFSLIIFYPPAAFGWFYSRLLVMKQWLISSALATLSASTLTVMMLINKPTGYDGAGYLLVALLTSIVIAVMTIAAASLMKKQMPATKCFGILTSVGIIWALSHAGLDYFNFPIAKHTDYITLIILCFTIAASTFAFLSSLTLGLRKTNTN